MAILSIIGALIGWITNVLAIKLMFRPIQAFKIPRIGYEIQGLIPKRRKDVAKSIGETVEKELISIEEILERMLESQNKNDMLFTIKTKINEVITQKLPSILPKSLKEMIIHYVNNMIDEEADSFIDQMIDKLTHKATTSVKIGEMVEQKINEFDLLKLEEIIISIAQKELKHIEYIGAILGFFIGVVQALIIYVI